MPEPISSQVDTAVTPAQTPESTPAVSAPQTPATPTVATPSSGAADVPSGASIGTPAVSPPSQPTWLSSLRERGMDFGNDEAAAFERLGELHRNYGQIAPLAPYVQQYMQYAPQFSKWLSEQQRQQQAPQQQDANAPFYQKYFNPPEYNRAWEQMLEQDENGNIRAKPGVPPDVVPKYLAYQQFKRDEIARFTENPHEYFKETITHLAREEAQKIVKEQFGQVNTQQSVQSFMQQNESWLYDKDANGQAIVHQVFNPNTGGYDAKPKLSQWGGAFANYVKEEAEYQQQRGLPQDVDRQRDLALAKVQRDYAVWKLNNQTNGQTGTPTATPVQMPVDPQQAANAAFLRQNNPAAGLPAAAGNSNPAPAGPVTRKNFTDLLRENFKKKGITDEALINSN